MIDCGDDYVLRDGRGNRPGDVERRKESRAGCLLIDRSESEYFGADVVPIGQHLGATTARTGNSAGLSGLCLA